MRINSYKIKISAFTSEIPEKLDREKMCLITTEAEIYEVSSRDNQDGTYDAVYKAKAVGKSLVKQAEKVMKAKDRSSHSQRMYKALYSLGVEGYEEFMEWFLATELEAVVKKYQNRFE